MKASGIAIASIAAVFAAAQLRAEETQYPKLGLADAAQKDRSEYKEDASYVQVLENPTDFQRRPLKFKVVFMGITAKLQPPYDSVLPPHYYLVDIENARAIPIVFSSKNDILRAAFSEAPPRRAITLFGSIKSKSFKRKNILNAPSEKLYYFEVDDMDADISGDTSAKKAEAERSKPGQPEFVSLRRLDIQHDSFVGKKICFAFSFKDINNRFNQEFTKISGISDDKYFEILIDEPFHTLIVAKRGGEECVGPLEDAKPGAQFIGFGVLKRAEDPAQKNLYSYYYVELESISEKK